MSKNNLNNQSVLSMKGEGYYSQKTIGAKNAIDKTQNLIENAIKNIPEKEILKIADFGSADGGTSQEMWFNIINNIKNSGDNRQIEILYTDLASNDFSVLFRVMQGMQGNSEFSYQKNFQMFLFMVVVQVFMSSLWLIIVCHWVFLQLQCIMYRKDLV